jgi:hypothetical protein
MPSEATPKSQTTEEPKKYRAKCWGFALVRRHRNPKKALQELARPRAANSSSRSPSSCQTNYCSILQGSDLTDVYCFGEQHGRSLTVQDEVLRSDFLVPVVESRDGWVAR